MKTANSYFVYLSKCLCCASAIKVIAALDLILKEFQGPRESLISTDIVDLLLKLISNNEKMKSADGNSNTAAVDLDLLQHCVSILTVDIVGHRKAEQFLSIIECEFNQ